MTELPAEIPAAGGVVWRPAEPGRLGPAGSGEAGGERLVCLVHRPRYDDWSLPKGKLKHGEHPLAGAVREVAEETGVRGIPQLPLPATRYQVAGAPKRVDYWAMVAQPALRARHGTAGEQPAFQPGSEVDRLAWLPAAAAADQVRYPHDARLLREWAALPPVSAVVLLVRHADAGARLQSPTMDRERPLSSHGGANAEALCRLLGLFAPARLVSASPRRCQETLLPLALAQDLRVQVDSVFDEVAEDPDAASARLARFAADGATTVVCSQRAVIPPVLARLVEQGPAIGNPESAAGAGSGWGSGEGDAGQERRWRSWETDGGREERWETSKGDGWLLSFAGARLLAVAPLQTTRVRQ